MNKQNIINFLENGDLKKAVKAFLALSKASGDVDLYNTAILFSGQMSSLFKDKQMGLITDSYFDQKRAQLKYGLLNSIDELPDNLIIDVEENKGEDDAVEEKPQGSNKKVFISYRHSESEKALMVKEKLESEGIEVWIDQERLEAGEDIEKFIYRSIKNTDFTVSLVSEQSLVSGWIGGESAVTLTHSRINGENKFIPCALDFKFFDDDFVDDTLEKIQEKIDNYQDRITKRREKHPNISTEDLEDKLQRFTKLLQQLPEIISHLNNNLTVDISEGKFDSGMKKVIQRIL